MNKVVTFTVAALAMGGAAIAQAEVTALVEVTKEVGILNAEALSINKTVTLTVGVEHELAGAAEAQAIASMTSLENSYELNGAQYNSQLSSSVLNHVGVLGLNQDTGNMANQANLLSASTTGVDGNKGTFANSQAEAAMVNGGGDSELQSGTATSAMAGSVRQSSGIIGVNQNSGNAMNQLTAVALAIGDESRIALSEAALGQTTSASTLKLAGAHSSASISGSLVGNTGIIGVNQSSGNNGNQAVNISVAASFLPGSR